MATVHDLSRWERDIKRQTEGWQDKLLVNGKGQPRPVEFNVAVVLQHHPDFTGRLRFNEFAHAAECSALPWKPCEGWRPWTDVDDAMLAAWCQYQEVMAKPTTCATAVQMVAAQHPHHPVQEYLDGLKWDGTGRLDGWLATYLGVKAEPGREAYLRQVGRKALIQAVARAYKPGCKADHMPVLRGPQGIGKSSVIRILTAREEWFADEIADLGSKDAAQDLAGKWIIEVPELAAIRGREVERTKAFVSRRVDHYRPSYGRRSQDHPRQCVFFGTTNADTYLQDETGNRRNWDIGVGRIDLTALRGDRDQLWAEAVAAFKAGETWWLDAEVEKVAAEAQAERRMGDPWEETVLEWAGRRLVAFTVGDALEQALNIPVERRDQAAQNRVARILKANGWERVHKREGKRWRWVYERPEPPDDGGGAPTGHSSEATGHTEAASRSEAHTGHNAAGTASSGHTGHGNPQEIPACDQCDQCDHFQAQTRETDAGREPAEAAEVVRTSFGNPTGHRSHWSQPPDDVDRWFRGEPLP